MNPFEHTDAAYWKDYDGLQGRKHQLLGRYLDAWFPILSTSHGLLLYVDSHAGRGRHDTGDAGSPVLVLERLLKHRFRDRILSQCDVALHLFENNANNAAILATEVGKFGQLPSKIHVEIHPEDHAAALTHVLDSVEASGERLAPSFAFVDPYGYKLSMALLNRFLRAGSNELMLNFMSRYVDIAIMADDKDEILDALFGHRDWRAMKGIADRTERIKATVGLFARGLDAHYVRWVFMRGEADEIKYVLFHVTNNQLGMREFKKAVWAVIPDGSYTAYERDRPEQGDLIGSNVPPPIDKVRALLWAAFAGKTANLESDIYPLIDASPYLHTHANQVLKEDVRAGRITNPSEPGKCVLKKNPTLVFADRPSRHAA